MAVNIVAVSYLNTRPFIYGLEQSGLLESDFKLQLANPSDCGKILLENKADIGLVPVAMLPKLPNYTVITDYCISAHGKVNTVSLFSDVPLSEIKEIYLDYQSETSVKLIRVLARELWKINPKWRQSAGGFEVEIGGATAGVIIGDRTFAKKHAHKYVYDLSDEWLKLTGKPFVFACWVAKEGLDSSLIESFNKALGSGVENKSELIKAIQNQYPEVDIATYLTDDIQYDYTPEKQQAMMLFLDFLSTQEVNS